MRTKLILIVITATSLLTNCTDKKETLNVPTQITSEAMPQQGQASTEQPAQVCDDHKYCATLREYEKKCGHSKNETDCKQFVEAFANLARTKDCKRSFDTSSVPSIWICDQDNQETAYPKLFERSAKTLSTLPFEFARRFYGSEAFRSTLDGAIAEEHYDKSVKAGASRSKID